MQRHHQNTEVTVEDNRTAPRRRTEEPEPVEAPAIKHRKQPPLPLPPEVQRHLTTPITLRPPLDPPTPQLQPENTLIWKDEWMKTRHIHQTLPRKGTLTPQGKELRNIPYLQRR
ncbi:hypothetical protein Bca52824_010796 [Brassica carinata]|uniref:Uncharacterized protein n=1 Tax=Brassica carinata TaxID=52824 RepID=A0A8X7WC28_BRACI|nr:hypothetical protein Bca52824_010796 [Brassica carinata]